MQWPACEITDLLEADLHQALSVTGGIEQMHGKALLLMEAPHADGVLPWVLTIWTSTWSTGGQKRLQETIENDQQLSWDDRHICMLCMYIR